MSKQSQSFWLTQKGLAALGLIAAASYFLFVEHREHVFEFLPYLILLLCPLMHVFMHGGHGRHGEKDHSGKDHSGKSHGVNDADQEAYQRGLEAGRKESEHQQHH